MKNWEKILAELDTKTDMLEVAGLILAAADDIKKITEIRNKLITRFYDLDTFRLNKK